MKSALISGRGGFVAVRARRAGSAATVTVITTSWPIGMVLADPSCVLAAETFGHHWRPFASYAGRVHLAHASAGIFGRILPRSRAQPFLPLLEYDLLTAYLTAAKGHQKT
jgi:hypothetical protein